MMLAGRYEIRTKEGVRVRMMRRWFGTLFFVLVALVMAAGLRAERAWAVEGEGWSRPPAWLGYRANDVKGPFGRWAVLIDGIVPGSPLDLTGAACGDWITAVETRGAWLSPRDLKDRARAGDWARVLIARRTGEGWSLWESWVRLGSWPWREPEYRCP